jgi:hypothetical protein
VEIDREIVLMLIRRKRLADKCWKRMADEMTQELLDGKYPQPHPHPHQSYLDFLDAQRIEASNAAECARRLLYGTEA